MERTFVMIKPDGVQRKLISKIISRFELKGFTLLGLKLVSVSKELAEKHYDIHKERSFFKDLVEFICSSPVIAMVWEGEGVVASSRKIIGATNPLEADSGSIRGDFAINVGRNLVHGSDAITTAEREIDLWFNEKELISWKPTLKSWLCE